MRLQLAARCENVLFGPKNLDILAKKLIFCLVIARGLENGQLSNMTSKLQNSITFSLIPQCKDATSIAFRAMHYDYKKI